MLTGGKTYLTPVCDIVRNSNLMQFRFQGLGKSIKQEEILRRFMSNTMKLVFPLSRDG